MSLRDALRSGASEQELLDIISIAVGGKKQRHAGETALGSNILSIPEYHPQGCSLSRTHKTDQ